MECYCFLFFLDQLSGAGSFFTAHLTSSHATLVCRSAAVEKHWVTEPVATLSVENQKFLAARAIQRWTEKGDGPFSNLPQNHLAK